MADLTDEEIVPSSQPGDTEMLDGDDDGSPTPQKVTAFGIATTSNAIVRDEMEDELTCTVCLTVMNNPYIIVECMHSVCRECLAEWWKGHNICPICKQRSKLAKHNFTLQAIVDRHLRATRQAPPLRDLTREDIYPRGRRPPMSLPSTQSQSQSQSQNLPMQFDALLMIPSFSQVSMGGQSQSQYIPALLPDVVPVPGGNLVFPCPSCDHNTPHPSGYVCPEPLPYPSQEQIDAEQQAYRPNGPPVRAPVRGEKRTDLNAARLNSVSGANTHNVCQGCTTYIPAGWEPRQQRCSDCGVVLCANYDPMGCPERHKLLPRSGLSGGRVTANMIWNTCPLRLRSNQEESRRFQLYIHHKNISIDQVLEALVDQKLNMEKQAIRARFPSTDGQDHTEDIRQADAECDQNWGAGNYFCEDFVKKLMEDNFFPWWMNERRAPQQPAPLHGLTDCWYGYECRTQQNPHHARLNHVCMNTYSG